jgi:clathrin heavy chain
VQPASINFNSVTLEGDNFLLVRETSPANSIVIVDMNNTADVQRRNMSADSAIMQPSQKILALRAAQADPATNQSVINLQVRDIQ